MQNKVMPIVREICNTESIGCRSLNKTELARQLLDIANVPKDAEIQEIPLDWDDQVNILFLVPDDINYYSLFAGITNGGKFYFQLEIAGIVSGNEFEFFDEDKILNLNYFCNR